MNFLEALQTYSPNGRKINSLTSTFKEFDDIFGGLPQYGVVSVIGEPCSKLESLKLSMRVCHFKMTHPHFVWYSVNAGRTFVS
jgi:hypothetical protein